jgi:hypothetical protein
LRVAIKHDWLTVSLADGMTAPVSPYPRKEQDL